MIYQSTTNRLVQLIRIGNCIIDELLVCDKLIRSNKPNAVECKTKIISDQNSWYASAQNVFVENELFLEHLEFINYQTALVLR
jgi:hypothetical protein